MAASSTNTLVLSITASAALTQFRAVNAAGAVPAAAGNSIGPAMNGAASGDAVPVVALGTAIGEAGAAITAGALLETNASGQYITRSAGAIVGRALTAAGAAGDQIEFLIIPN
ncbi:MAG: DUF2190 family protein [Oxalobacteraceae bacterium]|jgi:hypothetical protein|nr:DUF2190 family protein [Oxalobacteraceae bacterium]MCE2830948.1 DUF2190 family protein [Oxalobacteraceae bacterium]